MILLSNLNDVYKLRGLKGNSSSAILKVVDYLNNNFDGCGYINGFNTSYDGKGCITFSTYSGYSATFYVAKSDNVRILFEYEGKEYDLMFSDWYGFISCVVFNNDWGLFDFKVSSVKEVAQKKCFLLLSIGSKKVYKYDYYDRSLKKYVFYNYNDINSYKTFSGDKLVICDFCY